MSHENDFPRVGFIGLGAMGVPMARRVAEAGYPLMVFDADSARTAQVAASLSAEAAQNAGELGKTCQIVVTMLPTSDVVSDVLFGDNGLAAALARGSIVVDMTSGSPSKTQEIAKKLEQSSIALCDAPVSGGVPRAKTGELAIMLGGDAATIERIRPLVSCMGTSLTVVGGVGSAHAMKALNNLVSAGGFLIGMEALLIGSRFGLSPETMVDVLNASTGMNNSTQKKFKQFVLSRKFDAGFGLDLMVKDLGIALEVASQTDTTTPLSSLCLELWSAAKKTLGPGQDHTSVARFQELIAGSELGQEPR
ncbi:3-hydroxyisobutyrate dehydrogenase [Neorhizobium sp. 2083]|uniref:NAD(P)-dependent oxidoreductase n=1 Tax=Neorhizobium sp. 2083 TaxID=2817762 RepID=UPI00286763A2|nr:NAD(P)-dependent oxidoreductase [Neorhizobium sp. 2083]MDR6820921.1 3-hydroxyisobutyrate dehydrogenase [Neorhizobium sp. 2083]